MKRTIFFSVMTLLCAVGASSMAKAQYRVDRFVFGLGSTETKSAQNHIVGTLGQTLIGVTTNPSTTNHVGFWYGVEAVPVGVSGEAAFPAVMQLGQNFPNPVNGATTIPFTVTGQGFVRLSIVNILGEEIRTLVAEDLQPGAYHANFNAGDIPGGMYFYRLQTADRSVTRTLVIRK